MYKIVIDKDAKQDIKKLPNSVQKEVDHYLERLAYDPFKYSQPLTRELHGARKVYLSEAKYRIVFYIEHNQMHIVVIAIDNRQDVYKVAAKRLGIK